MEKYLTWIKAHERLLFVLILAALGWYGWHTYMSYREHELAVNADLKQKELVNAKEAANQAANLVRDSTAKSAAIDTSAAQAIAALQAQIANLSRELAARQKSDAALTDAKLASRWASLTGLGATDLLPQAGGGLAVTHAAAVATVQKLEEVPALKAQVDSQQLMLNQRSSQLKAKNDLIISMKDEADKLKVALAKAEPACDSRVQLAVQQQKGKDSKGNWVWRGVAFVLGAVVGHRL